MDPLVSVIIPVYNVCAYLREALDSVINQTYQNLEIIIIDDGSSDGSGSICDEYQHDPRVHVIHQHNKGLSGARNTGLAAAKGLFISFIDPDDAFYPDMIQAMINALTQSKADIAVCGYEVYDRILDRKKILDVHGLKEETLLSAEALNRLICGKLTQGVWNKIYKASLWKEIRFPEGYVYEDIRTTYRILEKANTIQTLSDLLYKHRKRQGSITMTDSAKNIQDRFLAFQELKKYVCDHTPAIFSERSRDLFLDSKLRSEELFCAIAMADPDRPGSFWISCRNRVLTERRTKCRPKSLKSLLAHGMFVICPRFIPPTRNAYRFCKKIIRYSRIRK